MSKEQLFERNVTAGDFTGRTKAMVSGDATSTITGPWLVGSYATDGPNTRYATFQIPTGTTQATVGVTDAYVMFKDKQEQRCSGRCRRPSRPGLVVRDQDRAHGRRARAVELQRQRDQARLGSGARYAIEVDERRQQQDVGLEEIAK